MKRWVLAAGLLAAALVPPAAAADLDGVPPPPWRGGAYGDPRWPRQAPPPPSYNDDDDDDGSYGGPPATRRYSYAPPGRYYAPPGRYQPPGGTCVRSDQVREHLTRYGWRDFHDGQVMSGSLVTLRARRPSGRLFELTLHRCSGEVVALRPLQLRPFGPYAYQQPDGPYGAWRWGPGAAPYGYGDPWQGRPYAYHGPRRWDRDYRD